MSAILDQECRSDVLGFIRPLAIWNQQERLLDGSGMSREVHVPFCERLWGQFPRSTHHSLHWVLDVTMNEDQARNRNGNSAENLALLRRMALNLARAEPAKGSMRGKIKKAGWGDDFMLNMIRAAVQV